MIRPDQNLIAGNADLRMASLQAPVACRQVVSQLASFLETYRVRTFEGQDSLVELTIPRYKRHLDFIIDAQKLSVLLNENLPDTYGARQAIWPDLYKTICESNSYLNFGSGVALTCCGCVPGTEQKNRWQAKSVLFESRMIEIKSRELVESHTAGYLLNGRSIFVGKAVRSAESAFSFRDQGLREYASRDSAHRDFLYSAGRLCSFK